MSGRTSPLRRKSKAAGPCAEVGKRPEEVVNVVDHALTSRRPKRRYLCDNVSRLQKSLVAITPTAVNDRQLGERVVEVILRRAERDGPMPQQTEPDLGHGVVPRLEDSAELAETGVASKLRALLSID